MRARSSRAIKLDLPAACVAALADPAQRIAEARRSGLRRHRIQLVARPADAFAAARKRRSRSRRLRMRLARRPARGRGARGRGRTGAARARTRSAQGRRAVILSGGELTVTIRGQGRGGPNQEYRPGARRSRSTACRASRRWPPTPTAPMAARGSRRRPGRGLRGRHQRRPRPRARPRSGRLSRRQQFDSFLCWSGRPGYTRTDLHQRQ